jgi:hypothetical protein
MIVTLFASCLMVTQLDLKNFFEEICGEVSTESAITNSIKLDMLLHMNQFFFIYYCLLKWASFAGFSAETSM